MNTVLVILALIQGQIFTFPMKEFKNTTECLAAAQYVRENVPLEMKGAEKVGLACMIGA